MSVSDVDAVRNGTAVRVRERLPGITPTHMCTRCPTFFRARDRFYLTARHEEGVHGIAVWPHGRTRIRIELTKDGLVFVFDGSKWALVPAGDVPLLVSDHFWGHGQREIVSWSSRRGFAIRLAPDGKGKASLRVKPPGPHFTLLVAKTWAQENFLGSLDQTVATLDDIGARPLVFEPSEVPS